MRKSTLTLAMVLAGMGLSGTARAQAETPPPSGNEVPAPEQPGPGSPSSTMQTPPAPETQPGVGGSGAAAQPEATPPEQPAPATPPPSTTPPATPPAAGAAAQQPSGAMPTFGTEAFTPSMLLNKLHAINLEQIAAGRLARSNSDKKDIRNFGDDLVKDATKADKKVADLSRKLGTALQDPQTAMTAMPAPMQQQMQEQRTAMDQLRTQKGTSFDQAFLANVVMTHRAAIDYLNQARGFVEDRDLRDEIERQIPNLQKHLQQAQDLAAKHAPRMGRR